MIYLYRATIVYFMLMLGLQCTWEKELESELNAMHHLYQKDLTTFARSYASDDVLFHEISTGQYYLVHLTWNQNKNERFPQFSVFSSFDDFIQYCEATFQFIED